MWKSSSSVKMRVRGALLGEGSVGEVHRPVAAALHQTGGALEGRWGGRCDEQVIAANQPPERLLAAPPAGAPEQVHRLGERRPRREHRQANRLEGALAALVVRLVGVDQRDQRTRHR
jgi:hypothetical protein